MRVDRCEALVGSATREFPKARILGWLAPFLDDRSLRNFTEGQNRGVSSDYAAGKISASGWAIMVFYRQILLTGPPQTPQAQ